jgi:hypothetical protein
LSWGPLPDLPGSLAFDVAEYGLHSDAVREYVDEDEAERLNRAHQVVIGLMVELGIDSNEVFKLASLVRTSTAWRQFEVLRVEHLGGPAPWRLDYAEEVLLGLGDELQWPFWTLNDPRLDRHSRRQACRRFDGTTRGLAVVRIANYAGKIACLAARHGHKPKTLWELPSLPEPDLDLPKPIGNRVYPQTGSFNESQSQGGTGRKKRRDNPVLLRYSDGTWDVAHLFHHTGAIRDFFDGIADTRGFDLQRTLRNLGRGKKYPPEDRKALAVLAALARRREATFEAIGEVAGGRGKSTVTTLVREGEEVLQVEPDLDVSSEMQMKRGKLKKLSEVRWRDTDEDVQPEDAEAEDGGAGKKLGRLYEQTLEQGRERSPYLTRYIEAEIEYVDPLERKFVSEID